MEENDLETRFIREEIGRCEDLEELKARIFPLLQSQQELWMQKMQEILAESGLTKSAFAKRCRVSRVSVDKWCKGAIPKNRETFLRIGMAAESIRAVPGALFEKLGRLCLYLRVKSQV